MNIALILSGGTGSRLGADTPKQYLKVLGKPVIAYCLEPIISCGCFDGVQIVADPAWWKFITKNMEQEEFRALFRGFSHPGANRQLSILSGLEDIRKYADADTKVLIHDAARPCISKQLILKCLDAAKGHDGVLPVLPMKDTVYFSEEGEKVSALLDRNKVFAGQAPEVFLFEKYYQANRALLPEKILSINGSTEPAILAGLDIQMILGEEHNFKITTKADLERFTRVIAEEEQLKQKKRQMEV